MILGGQRIAHPRGLVGHSDADVVCHAVADALLGAAGLGDIGEHYPDTDPRWQGLDSTRLLAEVVERIEQAGWRVVNCDVIIHAQEPKLGPHKPAIRANLARLLGVGETAVNVKAKTGEHVGPVGRGEAIVCEAVVLIEPAVSSRMSRPVTRTRTSIVDRDRAYEADRSRDWYPCRCAFITL